MMRIAFVCLALMPVAAFADDGQSGVWTYKFELPAQGGGFVTALSPSPALGGFNDPAYIVARCMSGRSEFMVGTAGGWAVTGQKLQVTSQVDDKPEVVANWDVSTNGKAVFVDDHVEDFMKSVSDQGKLRLAVKDLRGQVFENTFSTAGFGEVRDRIAKACSWKP